MKSNHKASRIRKCRGYETAQILRNVSGFNRVNVEDYEIQQESYLHPTFRRHITHSSSTFIAPCIHPQWIFNSYIRKQYVLFKNRARTTVQLGISAIKYNNRTLSPCTIFGDWTSVTLAMRRVHRNCGICRRLISVLHKKGGKYRLNFRILGPQKQIYL